MDEGRSDFARVMEEIHLGLVLMSTFFFLATLVLPCFIAMERRQPAPEQQTASAAPEAAAPEAAAPEAAAPEAAAQTLVPAAPEVAKAAPEVAKAADCLPEPYDTCPVYQPLRRSFSIQSTGHNPYVAGLLEEIQELRAMARVNATVGCSGFQNEPMGNFLTRSNSWMYHRPPPPPPRPALPSKMTILSEKASSPEPLLFQLRNEARERDQRPSKKTILSEKAYPPEPMTFQLRDETLGQDHRPPWAKNRHQTAAQLEPPTWARPRNQTWAGPPDMAETQV